MLLTDAVIFALGGSHLELGDHMLCLSLIHILALLLVACSKESDDTGSGTGGGGESGGVTEVTPVTSDLTVNLTTDKAVSYTHLDVYKRQEKSQVCRL